jgi:hypothetical protein
MTIGSVHRFSGTIYNVGINRCVDVPPEVANSIGGGRYIPVVVRIRNSETKTTLVPGGGGVYRLFVNNDVRRACGIDTGDIVSVEIEFDAAPELDLPDELEEVLADSESLRGVFERLAPGKRREMVRWVARARRPDTRAVRVARIVEHLRAIEHE